ncbi:putative mRNA 3-end processing factor [Pyrobaculum islandicum DSM 4184]|uniref:mRNA 3-end processing factor n=1 Tax=Pyrobaculum islandicum (strain DSM 4184 / JCM 9189 / GEO3) TaxID=384616 RepID=A1RT67_PYRIL|nr:MBL fold metallo-hydrolase [Pyrobaculum islandicum]ABL88149.1 putative mRNA 3-end processing factor [Pyrobaculum islandicum DSM 4184]
MNIYYDSGIYVEGRKTRFVVDPTGPIKRDVDFVLVTHGHSDHISRYVLRQLVVATQETFVAMYIRLGSLPTRRITVAPGKFLELDGVHIAVLEAGHILGSVMYLVEIDDLQVLFTGDFNTTGTILTDAAEPVDKPDILVMDATYGDPAYIFPNRAEVYNELLDVVERYTTSGKVAIVAYPLGKAQEVAKLFGTRAGAHITVARYNRALGIPTGMEKNVVIVPSLRSAPTGYFKVEVSGWYAEETTKREAAKRGVYGIPLSDHSDFPSLVEFVTETSPKLIYTVYGFTERFAKHLRRLGYRAYTIPGIMGLAKFF